VLGGGVLGGGVRKSGVGGSGVRGRAALQRRVRATKISRASAPEPRRGAVGKKKFEQTIRKYVDDVSWIFIAFLSASGELRKANPTESF